MDWSYLIYPIMYITSIGFTIDQSYPTSGAALPGGVGVGDWSTHKADFVWGFICKVSHGQCACSWRNSCPDTSIAQEGDSLQ